MKHRCPLRHLSLILTSRCNLECRYCYQRMRKPGRMDRGTLRAAIGVCLQPENRYAEILFLGGEPLLEFHLIRDAVEHVGLHRRNDQEVLFRISTNGTLLTDEIVMFLEENSFETQLSFDGIPAAQNFRDPETYTFLDRWLDRLRVEHPVFLKRKLSVSLTVIPETIAHLPASVEYLLSKGVPNIVIAPCLISDDGWNLERIGELDDAFNRVFEISLRHREKTWNIPVLLFRRREGMDPCCPADRLMCSVPEGEVMTVDVDGQVYGCGMFAGSYQEFDSPLQRIGQEALRMGSIHDPGFPERFAALPENVRKTGLFDRKQDKYSAYGQCRDCLYYDQCLICPAATVHRPGNGDPNRVSDFCCAFNRVALKYGARFPKQPGVRDLVRGTPEMRAEMERWRVLAEAAKAARKT